MFLFVSLQLFGFPLLFEIEAFRYFLISVGRLTCTDLFDAIHNVIFLERVEKVESRPIWCLKRAEKGRRQR